ncbi:hypothetical protein PV326_013237, partial [Microctonus aethiopoides]
MMFVSKENRLVRQDVESKGNESSHELLSTMPACSSSEGGDIQPHKLVRQHAFMGHSSYKYSIKLSEVRQTLRNDYEGEAILKNYNKTKLLSRKSANTVVNIFISDLLNDPDRRSG